MALRRPPQSVSLAITARPSRSTRSGLSLLDPCIPLSEALSWRPVKKARWRRTRTRCYDRRGCGGMVKGDGHPEVRDSASLRLCLMKRGLKCTCAPCSERTISVRNTCSRTRTRRDVRRADYLRRIPVGTHPLSPTHTLSHCPRQHQRTNDRHSK